MRVLLVHGRFQIRGGEDECFDAEVRLLREAGLEVDTYEDDNRRIEQRGRIGTAIDTVWSRATYWAVRARLRERQADIVHVHNYLPLISPAVYHAAQAEGAAVVQTLHNYRLMCPNALFFRDGRVCEDCLGRAFAWPGVVHGCYRGSRAGTAAIATMLTAHRAIGTWRGKVDRYLALNRFMRDKHIEGGLPAERIAIKPNFVDPDPGPGDGEGGYALFAARLVPEKGVATLLEAWERIGARLPLRIMGDGPSSEEVARAAERLEGVTYLGRRPLAEFYRALGEARLFVLASTWYEGFPRTVIECFARGVPLLISAIGPLAEVVEDGRTGLHLRPGDASGLVDAVERLLGSPDLERRMRRAARAEYQRHYTARVSRDLLLDIYRQVIAEKRGRA
jgi:glycosyltransferase involved in cell wall biosynthesis